MLSVFQSLRPLKFLTIPGLYDVSLLFRIIERHGQSLLGLIIEPEEVSAPMIAGHDWVFGYAYPRFDDDEIRRIAGICPHLEELRIQFMRT